MGETNRNVPSKKIVFKYDGSRTRDGGAGLMGDTGCVY